MAPESLPGVLRWLPLTTVVAVMAILVAYLWLAQPPANGTDGMAQPQLARDATPTPSVITPAGTIEAHEFRGIVRWLNSEPLAMSELRGRVVLIDFWTYS